MNNTDLTQYDIKPEEMVNYLRYNGPHFNKRLLNFAVSKMTKDGGNGNLVKITPFQINHIDNLLSQYNIILNNNQLYDYMYVANMCLADFWGSSIEDDHHLVKYIKDVIDDDDAYDGLIFNRWYADMCKKGIVIDWEKMI